MRCTEILKARVPPAVKAQAKAVADRELLTESAWLKRLVVASCARLETQAMRLSWIILLGEEPLTDGRASSAFTFAHPPKIGSC